MIHSIAEEQGGRARFSTWDVGRYEMLDAAANASILTENGAVALESKTRMTSMVNCSVSGGVVIDYGNEQQNTETKTSSPLNHRKQNRTLSVVLLLITDVVATLQGTLLKILLERGISLFSMLFITSLIGAMFAGSIMLIRRTPFVKEKTAFKSMMERGILGGLANVCAFYAVSKLNLGVASCLMFTMPLWTALLSYIVAGQKWDQVDIALAFSCLGGVVLVTEIWTVNEGVEALGFGAALAFAIINADAALVVNTKLRNEAPISMVFVTMSFGTLISGCIVLADDVLLGFDDGMDVALVFALSLGMPLMMLTRNLAFTMNNDTSIAMLLYLEIVLAFLWEFLLLGGGLPSVFQVVGSLMIIFGSCGSVIIKSYLQSKSKKSKQLRRDKLSFAEQFDPKRDYVIPTYQEDDDNYDPEIDDSFEGTRHLSNNNNQQQTLTNQVGSENGVVYIGNNEASTNPLHTPLLETVE